MEIATSYTPGLFAKIAEEVATRRHEQYIYARTGAERPAILYTSPGVEEALQKASDQLNDPVMLLQREYRMSVTLDSQVFDDGAIGKIDVQGFVVQVDVKEIAPNEWRVMFTRANPIRLGGGFEERLTKLSELTRKSQSIVAKLRGE